MMNDREMIDYLKRWNADLESFDDEEEAIAVHKRCINALETNKRAVTLLKACKELLNKQNESIHVRNILEQADYNGSRLLKDIDALLVEMIKDKEE